MMNGVIYARYSSHNQREESIDGQLRECKRYAKDNDIEIVGEYVDRAISGKTDNRVAFQKMIRDAEKGGFQVVIVYKLDRFARNRYDSATYKAKLKRCGVRLVSAMEQLSDNPESIILEAVLEGMAEYYSANLAQNIKRGMTENAIKGLATGGGRCLGYYTGADKKYHIDEAGAATVRLIYEMYDQGSTYTRIVKTLNDQGRKTLNGTPFNKIHSEPFSTTGDISASYMWDDIVIEGGMPADRGSGFMGEGASKIETQRKGQRPERAGDMISSCRGNCFAGTAASP